MTKEEADQYLDLFKISEKKFLVGIFQDGITIHKQQIRALNIFYALIRSGRIPETNDFTIGIIGGGVAGLTLAAAALKCRLKVVIIEKESQYLHMQRGCDIRQVHPNIYDWPEIGSSYPSTELPVLNWTYDTASNVARQILKEFDSIVEETSSTKFHLDRIRPQFNCTNTIVEEVEEVDGKRKILLKSETTDEFGDDYFSYDCDLLVYAVGYGLEKGIAKNNTFGAISYWRNDAYGQSFLNDANVFLVSGRGDGGMMDLFRLKIFDFNYDYIFKIMQSNPHHGDLKAKLLQIKNNVRSDETKSVKLYDQFKALNGVYYHHIYKLIDEQRRFRKTVVKLNSRTEFKGIFDLEKVSLLNAFIAYILFKYKQVGYVKGELTYDKEKKEYRIGEDNFLSDYQVIVRNGTNKVEIFEKSCFSNEERLQVEVLNKNQKKPENKETNYPLWTVGEINSIFNRFQVMDDPKKEESKARLEYLSSETKAICLSYITILGKVLTESTKNEKFSISLHRQLVIKGERFYQQVGSFIGIRGMSFLDGQVFPIMNGSIGLTFKTGRPYLVKNREGGDWNKLLELFNHNKSEYQQSKSKSYLTVPISAPTPVNPDTMSTNLVLFLEARDADFFTIEIQNLVSSTTEGFVTSISRLLSLSQIYMKKANREIPTNETDLNIDQYLNTKCIETIDDEIDGAVFDQKKLKFTQYLSFDLVYKNSFEN
jgi:hypothetical protein